MNAIYVQYGCGFSVGEGWLNFDASPTLKIERIPILGSLVSAAMSGNSRRFPKSVKFGDVRKGPLVSAGTAQGVYASHVLEHLSLSDCRKALANTYAMLAPDGVFRLIVPDLRERARIYVSANKSSPSAAEDFMKSTSLGREDRPGGFVGALRQFMGNSDHLWMWDENSMAEELRRAGFDRIRRCEKGDSGVAMFDAVEEADRFYDAGLGIRECAMEARKPR